MIPNMIPVKRRRLVKRFQFSSEEVFTFHEKSLKMVAGSFYIPKNNENKPLGEDAHFICADQQTLGVADGVGRWARIGVDAGEYARELMNNCVSAVNVNVQQNAAVNPKVVLNEAFLNTEAKGSSTACILTLDGENLKAANVGDSGFVVIRRGKIIYKSPLQQRGFNCPYQLGNSSKDSPSSAMEISVGVEAGDVIVAGTDGLFDNVYSYEIKELVNEGIEDMDMGEVPEVLAWSIAQAALGNSLDSSFCSPFARAASRAGHEHMGGKYDDITVVVAYIL